MLFAVVVLPTVLPLMVKVVPEVVAMPWKPWLMPLAPILTEPIVLLEILETVLAASQKIPEDTEPELVTIEIVIDPLPVPLPTVFPVVVPILALPAPK